MSNCSGLPAELVGRVGGDLQLGADSPVAGPVEGDGDSGKVAPGSTGVPLHPSETMWKEGSIGCPSTSVTDVVLRSRFPLFLT